MYKLHNFSTMPKRAASSNDARPSKKRRGTKKSRRRTHKYTGTWRKVGEVKGVDTDVSLATVPTTTNDNSGFVVLNLIQQGTGSWNRVGRKAYMKSVRCTLDAVLAVTTASPNNVAAPCLRIALVWDKQPSGGSIPTFDTIFGHTLQDGTEASSVLDAVKYDNMDRFRVLKECFINPNPGILNSGMSGSGVYTLHFYEDIYLKLKKETVFLGQSSPMTIADISSGALYLVYRTVSDTDTDDKWSINTTSFARLRYTD